MKKIIILLLPLIFINCVTIEIPEQIKAESPYEKKLNAGLEESINAVTKALEALGWKIDIVSRSRLIEDDKSFDKRSTHLAYIFTELKQSYKLLTSSYSIFNVRLESVDEAQTQISVRYLSVTPMPPLYREKFNYRNDRLAEKLFSKIDTYLNK